MTHREATFLRIAHGLLAASGLAWFGMQQFGGGSDPYSPVGHPAQPWMQAAHLLAAPAFLLAVGLIWKSHAWARIRSGHRARRASGLTLAILLLPAAASGYLLQVSVEPNTRAIWTFVHLVSCGLWLLAWVAHRLPRRAVPATGT